MLCFVPITCFVVMVMIGGVDQKGPGDGEYLSMVEVFDPTNPSLSCKLPEIKSIASHGSLGLTVCGGVSNRKSCQTFDLNSGEWKHSHNLKHDRADSLMWRNPMGQIMLIGGWDSSKFTTETLLDDGTTEESFQLSQEHRARYGKESPKNVDFS